MRFFSTTDWRIKRGMLFAGVVAAGCTVLSLYLPPWGVFCLAAAVLLSLAVPRCRHPVWVYAAVWAATFLILGGVYQAATAAPQRALAGRTDTLTATVIDAPASGHMVTVEVAAATSLPRGSRVLLYCSDQVAPAVGDTVHGEVELKALYATQKRAQANEVFLQAFPRSYDEEGLTVTAPSPSLTTVMADLRARLTAAIRTRLTGEEGALLAGLCLGELDGISDEVYTAFRRAGLPHILVVSGLHLTVIGGGAYALLRRLLRRRRAAAGGAMAVVVFFMLLVGLTPSVVRSGVACLVMLGGQLFMRRADGLNSLGFALLLLLAYSPYCLLDVGLLLSFGATAGVLCLTKPLQEAFARLRLWKPLADALAITLAASLPIYPLLGGLFGEVSVVSPAANLLAVAPSSIALVIGLIALPFAVCPPLSFVADALFYIAGWLMRWLMFVADMLGSLPCATVSTVRTWPIVYLTGGCGLVILCLYARRRGLMRRVVAFLAAACLLTLGADTLLRRQSVRVAVSEREGSAVLLVEQDGRYGLIAQDAAGLYVTDRLVLSCGGELDFLVVGGGDTPDAARVTALMRRVNVAKLFVGDGDFLTGLSLPAEPLPAGEPLALWDGTTLTADDGWMLNCRGTTLAVSPRGKACTADGVVFVGEPPPNAPAYTVAQGVLLTEESDTAALTAAARLPYPTTVTDNDPIYLTARDGGEWSVTLWP